jgi:hypothetical protein
MYRCGLSLLELYIYCGGAGLPHSFIVMFVYESMSSIGEEVNDMIYNYVGAFSGSML